MKPLLLCIMDGVGIKDLEYGNVLTAHTTNLVHLIITNKNLKLHDGKLGDIAPTMLDLLKLDIPEEMTGKSLLDE